MLASSDSAASASLIDSLKCIEKTPLFKKDKHCDNNNQTKKKKRKKKNYLFVTRGGKHTRFPPLFFSLSPSTFPQPKETTASHRRAHGRPLDDLARAVDGAVHRGDGREIDDLHVAAEAGVTHDLPRRPGVHRYDFGVAQVEHVAAVEELVLFIILFIYYFWKSFF